MGNIMHWYNQNRKKIWTTIILILVVIVLLWRLMSISGEKQNVPSSESLKIDTNSLSSVTLSSDKSALTGENIKTQKEGISTIDNFVSFCNKGEIEKAYNLLSNECKDELYPKLNDFKEKYYSKVFQKGKRNAKIENYIDNIYSVELVEDILSTGGRGQANSLNDYYTLIKENDGNYKLNINKYLGRTEYGNYGVSENVGIKVVRKDIYMDYEIYTLIVKNKTEKAIGITDIDSQDSVILKDENDLSYPAQLNELSSAMVSVEKMQGKNIRIKFLNAYSSTRKIKKMTFSKVILDYNEFLNYKFGQNYKVTQIEIDL